MAALFIDPGRLRTELALEAASAVPDGLGGHTESWAEVATLLGQVEPVSATSAFIADQRREAVTHRVTMRARAGVVAGMRLRKGSRLFAILTVHDPDESGRYLVCRTREELA